MNPAIRVMNLRLAGYSGHETYRALYTREDSLRGDRWNSIVMKLCYAPMAKVMAAANDASDEAKQSARIIRSFFRHYMDERMDFRQVAALTHVDPMDATFHADLVRAETLRRARLVRLSLTLEKDLEP